jgi:hypothetical protein
MRPAQLRLTTVGLATLIACGSGSPAQENKTNQQANENASRQEEITFTLLYMSNGVTRTGAHWGGKTYETPSRVRVYLTIVHLDSRERAKKEYEDTLSDAVKIVSEEKVQNEPATKTGETETRAVIILSVARECKEATAVVATAGRALRIIQSCSSDAALEFERQANRNEKENDQSVYR